MAQSLFSLNRAFFSVILMALGMLSAPSAFAATPQVAVVSAAATAAQAVADAQSYKLDTGDKVKVVVYGEDDLSGDFDVDGSGNVRLPLVGVVHAAGLTQKEFEQAVSAKLSQGYLLNPKVSVQVTNYRPFTILGEVNKPGEYPFENGMTALNAVAIGGGYTYRANEDSVYIRRKNSAKEVEYPADDKTLVFPGDTVRVAERIF
jgi:polysaccharide export outer membrane protein